MIHSYFDKFLSSFSGWDNNGGAEIGAELSRYERLKRLQERVEKFEEIAEEIMSTRRGNSLLIVSSFEL